MRVEHGFGPVWDAGSRVLVLGSVPSPKSREMRFYYGHPRNRFWPVMAAVFHDDRCLRECRDPDQIVGLRRDFALRHHMALWDVIESCDIDGASDASIRNAVPIPASCVVFGLTGASRLVAIRSYVPVREPSGAPNHAPLGGAARSVAPCLRALSSSLAANGKTVVPTSSQDGFGTSPALRKPIRPPSSCLSWCLLRSGICALDRPLIVERPDVLDYDALSGSIDIARFHKIQSRGIVIDIKRVIAVGVAFLVTTAMMPVQASASEIDSTQDRTPIAARSCPEVGQTSVKATIVSRNYHIGVGTIFRAGPGGTITATVSKTYRVTASSNVSGSITAGEIAKATVSAGVSSAVSAEASTSYTYKRQISSGRYGNLQYGNYGTKVNITKTMIVSPCNVKTVASGTATVPSHNTWGYKYWES